MTTGMSPFRSLPAVVIALLFWEPVDVFADDPIDTTAPSVVVVPELRGTSLRIAEQKANLRWCHVVAGVFFVNPKNWRSDMRPGHIYMQTPKAGIRTVPDQRIAVWQFRMAKDEQEIVRVPNLVGKNVDEGFRTLQDLGLDASFLKTYSLPPGSIASDSRDVIDQYPRPRQAVYRGTTILLNVFVANKED